MFKNLLGTLASPLTKYMGIAILVLLTALGGALYLSYKFYGDKAAAEVVNEQLEVVVEEERKRTEKAVESAAVINKAVSNVRKGEKEIDKASEKLQEQLSKHSPTQPTGDLKNEAESVTDYCNDFITDDDLRLLRKGHCLTDGDPSDCY